MKPRPAKRPYRRAAATAEPSPEEIEGDRLRAAGRLTEARSVFERVLAATPKRPEAIRGLARVKLEQQNPVGAEELFRKLIKLRPTDAKAHGELALALHLLGQIEAARTEYQRAVALDKHYLLAWRGLSETYERLHELEPAAEALARASELDPKGGETRLRLAKLLARLKRDDEATDLMSAVAFDDTVDPSPRAEALCELGRRADKAGQFAEAAALLERGKSLMRTIEQAPSRPDATTPSASGDDLFTAMTSDRFARWDDQRDAVVAQREDSVFPSSFTFLLSFPRSGTTLTEQVLAAHPAVRSTDEAPMIEQTLRAMDARMPPDLSRAAKLDLLTPEQIGKLRAAYTRAAADRAGAPIAGAVLLDKMPLNTLALPAIARFFPESRVIFALRDPRDVVLSCYLRLGAPAGGAVPYLSWERVARFYDHVMTRYLGFREQCPLPIMEVRYEDTVRDLPSQARRLTDFLELDWDDRVLRFYDSGRYVSSPTYQDVARPVHTGAIGRWRHYTDAMGDALDVLQPFVRTFGYTDDA